MTDVEGILQMQALLIQILLFLLSSVFHEWSIMCTHLRWYIILILIYHRLESAFPLFQLLLGEIHTLQFGNFFLFFLDNFSLSLMDGDINITFFRFSL